MIVSRYKYHFRSSLKYSLSTPTVHLFLFTQTHFANYAPLLQKRVFLCPCLVRIRDIEITHRFQLFIKRKKVKFRFFGSNMNILLRRLSSIRPLNRNLRQQYSTTLKSN